MKPTSLLTSLKPASLVLPVAVAVVVAVAAIVFSHGGPPSSPTSSTASSGAARSGHVAITIKNFAYHPAIVTVTAGTKVTVTNEDSVEHTATSNTEGFFETGALKKGESKSFTLSKPGTYAYHCDFHSFMHGIIKVVQ